ncbi:allophanate hydrolase subunit 1 [Cellulomonas sp. MW9]|uniref:Allophanate hydrolase subunit 1 n=1 Tax=Cellulomonas edaphi TaxID=3053468 RepID=A0ABT7S9H9_9CELL|nr:allophanate hydrolase subunit 1 [Cellulomons edaphi]
MLPFGDDAVLVELDDLAQVRALDDAVRAARSRGGWDAVVDQVPAARTLLLRGSGPVEHAALAAAVHGLELGSAHHAVGPELELPVTYDGPDLADVAQATGRSVEEVVRRHTARLYTVAFGGFMPGFAYLVGLDPVLQVPRLASPRERVPAGSVAIADEFSAVYPAATPGGWRLLGRCATTLWDLEREQPALLVPGTRVRFVATPR